VTSDVKRRFSELGDLKGDSETVVRMMNEPQWLLVGASVFKAQCVSCHGSDGSGLVGPNLTDQFYKNVKAVEDLPKVIADGAANGAMPAWKTRLHPNEVILVSSYVASLRGQNLPGRRGTEGEQIPPWPAAVTPPTK
jgi:cytochrome c oxidase cbb3-type subunit 3